MAPIIVGECINPQCKKTGNLISASLQVSRYFKVKKHCVGSGLCIECLGVYEKHEKQVLDSQPSPDIEDEKVSIMMDSEEAMEVDSDDDDVVYECTDCSIEDVIMSALEDVEIQKKIEAESAKMNDALDKLESVFNKEKDTADAIFVSYEKVVEQMKQAVDKLQEETSLPQNKMIMKIEDNDGISTRRTSEDVSAKTRNLNLVADKAQMSPPLEEVVPVGEMIRPASLLPPQGPLVYQELTIGLRVYAMRYNLTGQWTKGKILEIKTPLSGEKQYRVKYDSKKNASWTQMHTSKQMAYVDSAKVVLPVGTRIIAYFSDEGSLKGMYAGIIAEPPKSMNKYRYLVFFDDGYAQYVSHNNIRLVCDVSKEVWNDMYTGVKEFMKEYLKAYPERPMVKLQAKQVVKTEWNGKWWIARVDEVDGSLVKMQFDADNRTEWIYRGSTRLHPLFSELANAEANKATGKLTRKRTGYNKNKDGPYVEYTRGSDDAGEEEIETDSPPEKKVDQQTREAAKLQVLPKDIGTAVPPVPVRSNVAKKSTSTPAAPPTPTPASFSVPTQVKSLSSYTRPPPPPRQEYEGSYEICFRQNTELRQQFKPHLCQKSCLNNYPDDPVKMKEQNPLLIPMLFGWERHLQKYQTSGKRIVIYRAPCGRRLRTLQEIHIYLTTTDSLLTVDLFCFDVSVHCYGRFIIHGQMFCYIKDISYGKENVPVPCVNSRDRIYPDYVEYSTKRLPAKGVNINVDPEYLVGCDCEDDCSDPTRCACQQLTNEAAFRSNRPTTYGYEHRRLMEQIHSGIYECNSRCKCRKQCLNRVVQNGLQLKLQVFKTDKCNWGLRCLDDIPKGCFICIYAGQLLTEQTANEDGMNYGDEYLAELDYIESVEKSKDGYESDVVEDLEEGGENAEDQEMKEDDPENSDSGKDHNSTDSDYEAEMSEPLEPRARSPRTVRKTRKSSATKEKSEETPSTGTPPLSIKSTSGPIKKIEKKQPPVSNTSQKTAENQLIRKPRLPKDDCVIVSDSDDDTPPPPKPTGAAPDPDSEESLPPPSRTFNVLPDPKKGNIKDSQESEVDETKPTRKCTRALFGEEDVYIMDAKSVGNIGRYLNHCCTPNVFVQNVFVDTHDVRFPWVAFFAMRYIRAGDELTWDYSYQVGSVAGKYMECHCGSTHCRGRLL